MEYVDGITMSQLSEEQKEVVNVELQQHLDTLHGINSKTIGGPSGIVIPPYRVMRQSSKDVWTCLSSETWDYVFCHNDISQQNVIVDSETLKIKALEGERDDVAELLQLLNLESTN
ncbi:hypothetical protein BDV30DRAFT_97873 [Aspergillus minisclerotigenes]|uniref:Aminoglycoside phosphotransferase domain-containing protein n=1 Tax=Aspergillus minisclerotigenes TaxID=656917 RepID=A0A5N6J5G5_9EURO|nr:hypothetical protein BDV30DRAFT_97873 [Aspergillus minisclerotigenes]